MWHTGDGKQLHFLPDDRMSPTTRKKPSLPNPLTRWTSVALGPVDIITSKLMTSIESLQQAFLF